MKGVHVAFLLTLMGIVIFLFMEGPKVGGPLNNEGTPATSEQPGVETRAQAAPPQPPESVEYQLAVVDRGGYVAPDDVVVARFRSLLQQLSAKYANSPQEIGNMSVKARDSLREKGVTESILNIMEGMNQVLARPLLSRSGANMQKYEEYLTLYILQPPSLRGDPVVPRSASTDKHLVHGW